MSCSLFKDLTLCVIYILIPSLLYLLLLVSPFLYPVPSHSCDPLEDLLPSLSQYGSASALLDDEDLEFWWLYLRIHFYFCEFLCLSCQLSPIGWQSVESYPCSTSITSIHLAWIALVLWGFWRRPSVHIYGLSCARLCCGHLHSFQIFEDSSLFVYCGFDPPL